MAIEIIPKPRIKVPVWATGLLSFSMIALLAAGATYFYFYQSSKKMTQEIEETKQALIDTPEEKALEADLLAVEKRVNAFGAIFSTHKPVRNIFTFLEQACHPEVEFSNFNFNSKDNSVAVSGSAKSFVVLGQQIMILRAKKELDKIILSEISLGKENGVDFAFQLTFNSQIFKQ